MGNMENAALTEGYSTKLLQSLSIQDPILLNKALNAKEPKKHRELSWFEYAMKRAVTGYPTAEGTPVRNEIFRLLMEKLSIWTLGFDINYVIALSGEVQEQAEAKDCFLVILPYKDCSVLQNDMLLIFDKASQKEFDLSKIHAIRKQLNLAKDGALAVCKDSTGLFHTVGILKKSVVEHYPRFYFLRRLQWEFFIPKTQFYCDACRLKAADCKYTEQQIPCHLSRIRYDKGAFMMPITDLHLEIKEIVEDQLEKSSIPNASDIAETIASIIDATRECKKGAILIFSDASTIKAESEHLSGNHRGLQLTEPIPLKNKIELVSRMAAIDGAILVDHDGFCHAYGIILDGVSVAEGNSDRGARYNSSKAYIDSHQGKCFPDEKRNCSSKLIGVVRSEDGALNLIY